MKVQLKWSTKRKVRKSQKATIRRLRFEENRTGTAYSRWQRLSPPLIYAYDHKFLSRLTKPAKDWIGIAGSVRFYSGYERYDGQQRQ